MSSTVKTIEDLPHFSVSAVKMNEKNNEYFELTGIFDRTEQVAEGRCSLLLPIADALNALPGYLEFQNQEARTARIYTPTKKQPEIIGQTLTYVPRGWDPLHVWMVALTTWKWTKSVFQSSDAIGEVVEGTDVSIVDNEEIREWVKISQKGKSTGLSRYYPVFPSGKSKLQIREDGTIENGWNHIPCWLCHENIDAGQFAYVDPSDHWVCEECYKEYVAKHDLSFMF